MVCSRCVGAWYCSQVCQVGGWSEHKGECGTQGEVTEVEKEQVDIGLKTEIKKRVVSRKRMDAPFYEEEICSPRFIEDSPPLDTASIASKESTVKAVEQNTVPVVDLPKDPSPNLRLGSDADKGNDEARRNELNPGFSSSPDIRLDTLQDTCQNAMDLKGSDENNFIVKREAKDETVVREDVNQEAVDCVLNGDTIENLITFSSNNSSFDLDKVIEGQAKEVSDGSEDDSPFQSILTLKKESVEEKEAQQRKFRSSSLEDNLKCHLNPGAALPLTLPSTWTRVVSCTPDILNPLLYVKLEGMEQDIKAKLGRVRLIEPWGEDVKTIMDMVLGEGREGQVELWVKNIGWEGDIQIVDIKDNEGNDIATLLTQIGITEIIAGEGGDTTGIPLEKDHEPFREKDQRIATGRPDSDELGSDSSSIRGHYEAEIASDGNNRVDAQKLKFESGDQYLCTSSGVRQLEPLMVTDVEKGYALDGTLVRLKDIGNSSQEGLVRCLEEKERSWLEEVMGLSDASVCIETPLVGQLVAFKLLTRLGAKVVRAEVMKVNSTLRKVQCQCLDYHDRRWEDYEKLFQPPPACLSIPPLCIKVVLRGVPDIQRKEAKTMLEKIDQSCLNQPLTLRAINISERGQVVELLDAEGNSVNEVLKEGLVSSMNLQPEDSNSCIISDFPVVPLNYADLTSYVPIPLNTTVAVIILYVESPTHLFVCPASSFEALTNFQVNLQAKGQELERQGNVLTPEVGHLVLMKSKEDHQWYRGTVIKMHKTKAKIYCPDFGFVEKVPMSMLRSIIDCDITRAKYWASHCALVDWGQGEEEATTEEKDRIKKLLVVGEKVDMRVITVDSVNYTVDIAGINRYVF